MEAADALQNVFDAAVELGQEGRGGCLFPQGGLPVADIAPQGGNLPDNGIDELQFDVDFLLEIRDYHISTLPRSSIRLVKRVGGVSGTRSRGTCSSSSSRAASS